MLHECANCQAKVAVPPLGAARSTVTCAACGAVLDASALRPNSITTADVADISDPMIFDVATTYDPVDTNPMRIDNRHTEPAAPNSAFELELIDDSGYDDRMIVPSSGLSFGRVVRCLVGAGWALVAIQLLTWWLLRLDPVALSQYVPPEVAFILPPEMRPLVPDAVPSMSEMAQDLTVPDSPIADSSEHKAAVSVASAETAVASESLTIGSRPTNLSSDPGDLVIQPAVVEQPATVESHNIVATAATGSSKAPTSVGAAGGAAVPDYISTAAAPPDLHPETIFIDNGPRWTDVFTKDDVDAAVLASQKANQRFDQVHFASVQNQAELKKNAQLLYAVACNLAEQATMIQQEDAVQSLERSRAFLQTVSTDRAKTRMFANAARNWMNRRLGKGVVLPAKVQSVRAVGDLFEVNTQLLDSKRTFVTVVTRMNPADNPWTTFSKDDNVIISGVMVDDPEVRLPGYLGNDFTVVYATDQFIRLP